MANNKIGLSYYSIDTDRYQDIKIKRLKKRFGGLGIAIYDYILCEIYRVKGCYVEWDENRVFDVAEYFSLPEITVTEVVDYCCNVGLFDKVILDKERVITSRSIQIRFIDISKRAKRSSIIIPENIKIVREESGIIREETAILREESDDNGGSLPQSKENNSKIKDKKEECSVEEDGLIDHTTLLFKEFQLFLNKYTPQVKEMSDPFTLDQFKVMLSRSRGKTKEAKLRWIGDIVKEMHNKPGLTKKYYSAFSTYQIFEKQKIKQLSKN